MMAKNTCLLSFFIVCTLFIIGFKSSEAQLVPAVFVFGDSLVDVGNNNYLPMSIALANFPPNGVDFPTKKPTGRFSNGKNVADFFAEKVGLPTSPPYLSVARKKTSGSAFLRGVNFASGGAGIFNETGEKQVQVLPLANQTSYYESVYISMVHKLGSSSAKNRLSKSLFVIIIGSNDIFDYSDSSVLQKKSTPQHYVHLMSLTLKVFLKRLYSFGARKFAIPGIAPLGCVPFQRIKSSTKECNEKINSMAVIYNEELKSMLQKLKSELKGLSFSYFDTYAMVQNIGQRPANYGFTEVKAACCGGGRLKAEIPCLPTATYCRNRRDHFFWDFVHPTEAAASIVVDNLFDGPSKYTFPITVRQLVTV